MFKDRSSGPSPDTRGCFTSVAIHMGVECDLLVTWILEVLIFICFDLSCRFVGFLLANVVIAFCSRVETHCAEDKLPCISLNVSTALFQSYTLPSSQSCNLPSTQEKQQQKHTSPGISSVILIHPGRPVCKAHWQ
jgi:hypothetical protein